MRDKPYENRGFLKNDFIKNNFKQLVKSDSGKLRKGRRHAPAKRNGNKAGMLKQFYRAEQGTVAVMFGLLIFLALLAGGLAVDFQRANAIRVDLQESADAGLIAAVRFRMMQPNMSDEEVEQRAREFFDANRHAHDGIEISDFAVHFDAGTSVYHLEFNSKIETLLLRAVGWRFFNPAIISEAKLGQPPYLEVVMALDNTGSMNDDGKLGDLKSSATMLVNTLSSYPGAEIKFGLVPFAQYVNVGPAFAGSSWLDSDASFVGCVGSRNYPANIQDADYAGNRIPGLGGVPCPQKIQPLTDNKATILDAVNAMTGAGWTYIPSGLAWGWRLLSPAAPFTEGADAADLTHRVNRKALILMTDGENTRSPDYPTHDSNDTTLANQLTEELCEAVKADGIVVYTIAFKVSELTIKMLLEDCGSTPQHYYDATNTAELAAAFESIATSLRSISLSR